MVSVVPSHRIHAVMLLVVVLMGVGAVTANAGDFYVDPSGSDGNDGTTPATAFATIQRAVDIAEAGDVIHLAPGSYLQDVVSRRDGTAGAPITITGPTDAVVRGAGGSRIVQVHHDHLTLEGFTIDGLWGSSTNAAGYRDKLLFAIGTAPFDGVTGLRVLGMAFRNAGGECLRLRYFAQANEIAHSSFANCGIYDFVFNGGGKNGEAIYIGTAPEQLDDGKNPTDDPDESNGNWIHHNSFDTRGNECVDIKEAASQNVVEHNVCTGQRDPNSAGFDARGSANVFRHNESFANLGAGVRLGGDEDDDGIDNDVYANHIHDNAKGGIKIMRVPQGLVCSNTMANNEGGDAVGDYGDELDPTAPCGVCGNGMSEPAEACDDGNVVDGDGCDGNCTPTGCGNGVVTSGEGCDDGNLVDSDCCSALCQLEADGTPCTDANRCTHSDQCTQGLCAGITAPIPDCRSAARNTLLVKNRSADSQDQITVAWRKGEATTLADFGDPVLGTTGYVFCLYDEMVPEVWAVRSAIDVRPGGLCRDKPCWSTTRTGYSYRDGDRASGGLEKLMLRVGESGRAEVKLKAKGERLATSLPLTQTSRIVMQLVSDTGLCWASTYDVPASRNDDGQFKDIDQN